jgi:hypothetical protein
VSIEYFHQDSSTNAHLAVIKRPSIFQVVNWVGSVHLQGLNLSHGVQIRFDFILQMLKEGKYKKAIQDCEGLLDDLQKGLL